MIGSILGFILKPLIGLGEKYLESQTDKVALKEGTKQVAINADAAVRQVKLRYLLGRIPLFVGEISCAIYIAAILIDSTFASDLLNPLELPEWFKDDFSVIVGSIFGLAVAERLLTGKGK